LNNFHFLSKDSTVLGLKLNFYLSGFRLGHRFLNANCAQTSLYCHFKTAVIFNQSFASQCFEFPVCIFKPTDHHKGTRNSWKLAADYKREFSIKVEGKSPEVKLHISDGSAHHLLFEHVCCF